MLATASALTLLVAAPLAASETPEWTRAATPDGVAAITLPCPAEATTLRMREIVQASLCEWSGIKFYLAVFPKGYARFSGDRVSFEALRDEFRSDPDTEYTQDVSVSGFDAFYGQGHPMNSEVSVGTGVVSLGDNGVIMLLAVSNGSPEAQSQFSQTFVRAWESLEVIAP